MSTNIINKEGERQAEGNLAALGWCLVGFSMGLIVNVGGSIPDANLAGLGSILFILGCVSIVASVRVVRE